MNPGAIPKGTWPYTVECKSGFHSESWSGPRPQLLVFCLQGGMLHVVWPIFTFPTSWGWQIPSEKSPGWSEPALSLACLNVCWGLTFAPAWEQGLKGAYCIVAACLVAWQSVPSTHGFAFSLKAQLGICCLRRLLMAIALVDTGISLAPATLSFQICSTLVTLAPQSFQGPCFRPGYSADYPGAGCPTNSKLSAPQQPRNSQPNKLLGI